MNHFFISTPLGFEEQALQEMKQAWPFLLGKDARPHSLPFPGVKVAQGGLEFETDFIAGLQLNFFMKTANRVLLRLAWFRARDLPKFYQKFKTLPWKDFLHHGHVEWEVAAQKSRINNEKRLQESAEKALEELFPETSTVDFKAATSACATIYIRMDDDDCTISLDATGEHLHKRGWTSLKGEAPLRETIAAYLLQAMIGSTSAEELSKVTLVDPMMGSGTFLTEARGLGSGQFTRPFAFQKWKRAPKLFLSPSFVFNYELPVATGFKSYIGFDVDTKSVDVAQKNFDEVEKQLSLAQRKNFQAASVDFSCVDALTASLKAEAPVWMIVNPPYGERLPAAVAGVGALAQILCQRYRPQKLGVLHPEKDKMKPVPDGYQVLKELKINNGGIRCLFTLLTRL